MYMKPVSYRRKVRFAGMVNIREVAKIAGVSPATVSRVINGSANVSLEKRERVLQAVAQTEFVPNETARTLFKKSARTIGLIIPSIKNPYFTQLASLVDEITNSNGYRLFLCNAGNDLMKERAAIQMLVAMNADGIMIASSNEEVYKYVDLSPVPVVAIDSMFPSEKAEAYIYCDYYQGGRMAMEHLLECGCRNVVCIQGPQEIFSAKRRYEGYRDVCRERGIPEYTVTCDYDFNAGLAMTEELLETYPDVDGIIACNDVVALSTYKILHRKNISVPDQVQLIGFDDIMWANLFTPALTTISQPIHRIATRAMELIMDEEFSISTKKGAEIVYPVKLTIRETTRKKGS